MYNIFISIIIILMNMNEQPKIIKPIKVSPQVFKERYEKLKQMRTKQIIPEKIPEEIKEPIEFSCGFATSSETSAFKQIFTEIPDLKKYNYTKNIDDRINNINVLELPETNNSADDIDEYLQSLKQINVQDQYQKTFLIELTHENFSDEAFDGYY
jgi:hypothetical protein